MPYKCLLYTEPPQAPEPLQAALDDLGLPSVPMASVGSLLQCLRQQRPHVIVVALRPDLAYALDVVGAIRLASPLVPLLVVAAFESPADRLWLVRQNQAYDVVPPAPEGLGHLAMALQGALKHVERTFGPWGTGAVPSAPPVGLGDDQGPKLTSRELEVLREIAEGRSNAEVARRLKLSTHTVRNTLYRVYGKLGADSRTHAVAVARSSHLV
jgi:DNA-binding CsgD family transcriptional regulator